MVMYIQVLDGYVSVHCNHDAARGVLPDFPVKHSIGELITGVDKDFELASELARESR